MIGKFIHCNQPKYQEFDAKIIDGNRFYFAPDGEKYPSVTTVVNHGPKPWLDKWRKALGEEKAAAETKRASNRGTSVHLLAEEYLQNKTKFSKQHTLNNIKLFNQIKPCLNKINNIRAQEIPLFSSRLKIAGRVDAVAEYDGILSIIDFKTSNNNKKESQVQNYFLQSTAYALMYEEMFGVPIDDIVIIIAVEKGIMPMVYKKKIDEYVKPLINRINTFYADLRESNENIQ